MQNISIYNKYTFKGFCEHFDRLLTNRCKADDDGKMFSHKDKMVDVGLLQLLVN